MEVPTYTEMEYTQHLTSPEWSREETDHLMDLASRFGSLLQYLIHDHCIAGNGHTHWVLPRLPQSYDYFLLDSTCDLSSWRTGGIERLSAKDLWKT